MLAPIAWRTPPLHYGPWEQVTSLITEGLVALGIDVTLFATGDSVTAAELTVCVQFRMPRTRTWTGESGKHCMSRTF